MIANIAMIMNIGLPSKQMHRRPRGRQLGPNH